MAAEFDDYARNYQELLRDPIRDRFAGSADFFHRRKSVLITEFLRRSHFPMESASWLDVGCGMGELLALAGGAFARAVGCDPSEEMTGSAAAEVHHQRSPEKLPFESGSFDFVTAVCVYHHVEEQDRAPLTHEINRVLRPSGVFCMIEHNPLNPATQIIVHRTPVDANARLLTAGRAKRYLREGGFHEMTAEYFLYFPETFYEKVGFLEKVLKGVPLGGQFAVFALKSPNGGRAKRR